MESSLKIKRPPYRFRNTLHVFDASCIQSTGLRIEIPEMNIFRFQTMVCILCIQFKDASRLWTKRQRHKFKGRNTLWHYGWIIALLLFQLWIIYTYTCLERSGESFDSVTLYSIHSVTLGVRLLLKLSLGSLSVLKKEFVKSKFMSIETFSERTRGEPSYLHTFPLELN